jgi:hypothetical protein
MRLVKRSWRAHDRVSSLLAWCTLRRDEEGLGLGRSDRRALRRRFERPRPQLIRVAELPEDRILTGRVRNTSLRPVDLSVDRIEIVDARGQRLRSTARFLQTFAHGLYPPSMHVKGGKLERTRIGQIATVKPGQDLPLTLSWRLASSTAQPLEVRFGGGSLALPR